MKSEYIVNGIKASFAIARNEESKQLAQVEVRLETERRDRRTTELAPVAEFQTLAISGNYRGHSGQCGDTIKRAIESGELTPLIPSAARLLDIWEEWHLNAMSAGTEAQNAAIKADRAQNPEKYRSNHFDAATELLKSIPAAPYVLEATADNGAAMALEAGPFQTLEAAEARARTFKTNSGIEARAVPVGSLYVDRGYLYGTAWLVRIIPPETIAELHRICTEKNDEIPATIQAVAEAFLKSRGLEFRAVLVGDDCPTFCEDSANDRNMDEIGRFPRNSHIHGRHYRCTISGKERGHISFDFWNSYKDAERNYILDNWSKTDFPARLLNSHGLKGGFTKPKAKRAEIIPYDLLACIQKRDPGTFDDFCMEYGYDQDSRRAETVHRAVVDEYRKVRRFFTAEELEELEEIS